MSPTRNPSSEPPQRQALQISTNNLIKRVKRAAFGFTNFDNYRIRALLYRQTQLGAPRNPHSDLKREEPLNGMLRDKGGLEDKWCRSLGFGARFVGSVMMLVAHGLRETRPEWASSKSSIDEELLDDEDEIEAGRDSWPAPGQTSGHTPKRPRDGPG